MPIWGCGELPLLSHTHVLLKRSTSFLDINSRPNVREEPDAIRRVSATIKWVCLVSGFPQLDSKRKRKKKHFEGLPIWTHTCAKTSKLRHLAPLTSPNASTRSARKASSSPAWRAFAAVGRKDKQPRLQHIHVHVCVYIYTHIYVYT